MSLGSTLAIDRARALRAVPARKAHPVSRPSSMTPRLTAVHDLMAAGFTNKEIANKLRLSEGTVKVYSVDIFRILGESRHHIMANARQFYVHAAEGLPRMGKFE